MSVLLNLYNQTDGYQFIYSNDGIEVQISQLVGLFPLDFTGSQYELNISQRDAYQTLENSTKVVSKSRVAGSASTSHSASVSSILNTLDSDRVVTLLEPVEGARSQCQQHVVTYLDS